MQFLRLHPKQKLMDYFGRVIAQEIDDMNALAQRHVSL
jgi:hypothetical protein